MKFTYNDGGRRAAGFTGDTGDCATRACAIATGTPYQEVYDRINALAQRERKGTRKRGTSNARTGVHKGTFAKLMHDLGWRSVATMGIGTGCQVHLRDGELPMGRIVCNVSKHYVAVVDGVIQDTFDPSRDGTRCVYAVWLAPGAPDWTPTLTDQQRLRARIRAAHLAVARGE